MHIGIRLDAEKIGRAMAEAAPPLSQTALARLLGMDPAALSRRFKAISAGRAVSPRVAGALAKALGLTMEDLRAAGDGAAAEATGKEGRGRMEKGRGRARLARKPASSRPGKPGGRSAKGRGDLRGARPKGAGR